MYTRFEACNDRHVSAERWTTCDASSSKALMLEPINRLSVGRVGRNGSAETAGVRQPVRYGQGGTVCAMRPGRHYKADTARSIRPGQYGQGDTARAIRPGRSSRLAWLEPARASAARGVIQFGPVSQVDQGRRAFRSFLEQFRY